MHGETHRCRLCLHACSCPVHMSTHAYVLHTCSALLKTCACSTYGFPHSLQWLPPGGATPDFVRPPRRGASAAFTAFCVTNTVMSILGHLHVFLNRSLEWRASSSAFGTVAGSAWLHPGSWVGFISFFVWVAHAHSLTEPAWTHLWDLCWPAKWVVVSLYFILPAYQG